MLLLVWSLYPSVVFVSTTEKKERSHKIRIKELTKFQTWTVIRRFRRKETGPNNLREKGEKIGQ